MISIAPKDYIERDFDKYIYYINSIPLQVKSDKHRIASNITAIKQRFSDFETNQNRLENITSSPFTKSSNIDLYNNLYDIFDNKKTLKDNIRKIYSKKCPYCGTLNTPKHVDHFIPRSDFPEYSVFVKNLVPSCSICNSDYKGNLFLKNGERQFFNPYFDNFINDIVFLKCDIIVDNDIYPEFIFSIDDSLESSHLYQYTIIKNHFNNLDLATRYEEQINSHIFARFKEEYIIDETLEFEDITLEELKLDIDSKIRSLRRENDNYWEKVFWKSLKNSDECLNLIVNKEIPIN